MSGTLIVPSCFHFMWNWQYLDNYSLLSGDKVSGTAIELYNYRC